MSGSDGQRCHKCSMLGTVGQIRKELLRKLLGKNCQRRMQLESNNQSIYVYAIYHYYNHYLSYLFLSLPSALSLSISLALSLINRLYHRYTPKSWPLTMP